MGLIAKQILWNIVGSVTMLNAVYDAVDALEINLFTLHNWLKLQAGLSYRLV